MAGQTQADQDEAKRLAAVTKHAEQCRAQEVARRKAHAARAKNDASMIAHGPVRS